MRLAALILSILFGVSTISVAGAAPKKAAKPPAQEEDLNANSKKALRDALPFFMPSVVMIWMLHNKEVEAKEAEAAKKTQAKTQAKAAKPKQVAAKPSAS